MCVSHTITSGATLRSALLQSRIVVPHNGGTCPDAPGQRPPPGMWTRGHRSPQVYRRTTASTSGVCEGCALAPGLAQKKKCVTPDLRYANPCKFNDRLP